MKDTLFVLRPGFDDKGNTYFCPFSAQVIGFLDYYPAVRDSIDLIEIDFPKPRVQVVAMVGELHQAVPLLVLGGDPVIVPDVRIDQAGGNFFVEKTIQILKYLAATRSCPMPH
jgi:hypothetical protein